MQDYETKYLKGPHWVKFRKRVLEAQREKRGHNCCEQCPKVVSADKIYELHVHHTYL